MADTIASQGARAPLPPYLTRTARPLSWIKLRARRLERAFSVTRREAVTSAGQDWTRFNPTATH